MSTIGSSAVEELLHERLAKTSRITFAEFMELVLYHPELGYYATHEVLGPAGDYVTGPELHPAFGALLGRQVEDCWQALGRPSRFRMREVGAGTGALCRDVLLWARCVAPDLVASMVYEIVERSAALVRRQQQALEQAGLESARVEWLDTDALDDPTPPTADSAHPELVEGPPTADYPAHPEPVEGPLTADLVLSNELLDSFPVHLVTMRGGELLELYVSQSAHGLHLVEDLPSTPELRGYFAALGIWPGEGCRAEVNLDAARWMASLASWLRRGMALTLDYGHPAPELYAATRRHGTLLCYDRHTLNSDPFRRIGRQDITSHVDFTSLARVGEKHGLATIGLISQARLLSNLGLPTYHERFGRLPSPERDANRRALLELVAPQGLGRVGALFQLRGMDGYVPLSLHSDAQPPDDSYLPTFSSSTARPPAPEALDGSADFLAVWRAFVSGDESALDDPEAHSLSFL